MTVKQVALARVVYRHALCHLIERAVHEILRQDRSGEPGEELVEIWGEVRDARIELRTALLDGTG